jgi:uroporphyrinogen-III synthase
MQEGNRCSEWVRVSQMHNQQASMPALHGARVALLESRLSAELAELVRRMGGTPVSAPSVREVPRPAETAAFIDGLAAGRFRVVVFQTGVGASALLREAERQQRLADVLGALRGTTLVCRGPKPTAVVRRYGLEPTIVPVKPFTSKELLEALAPVELAGEDVALVHYGERNTALADALRARGATLAEVCPYEWALPEDLDALRAIVRDPASQFDAIAFTSQVQVRNLFAVAADMGLADALATALSDDVIVAAVGPVCADALKAVGVTPDVQPADPKMGPLLAALADYIELTRGVEKEE